MTAHQPTHRKPSASPTEPNAVGPTGLHNLPYTGAVPLFAQPFLHRSALRVGSELEERHLPLPVLNCHLLALVMPEMVNWIPAMTRFFRNSHKIERLMIDFSSIREKFLGIDQDLCNLDYGGNYRNYWRYYMRNFVFSHLKTIELFGICATECVLGHLFEFVEYLLKNALVLQKMIIHRDADCPTDDVLTFVDKLLSFPRSSPDAVIIHRNT